MRRTAALLVGVLLLIAARVSPGASEMCVIRGVVIDARNGRVLPQTQVLASLTEAESEIPVRHLTDAAGRFCFQNLTPGDYIIKTKRTSYLDTVYGEKRPGGTGVPVRVAEVDKPAELVLRMTSQATISGLLVDSEGDPISPARIVLLQRIWVHGKISSKTVHEAATDDQGAFRFSGLLPRSYYLSAERGLPDYLPMTRAFVDGQGQPAKEQEAKTYYAGALSFQQATPIILKTGEQVGGLTLVLRKVQARHITGRLSSDLLEQRVQEILLVQHMDNSPGVDTSVSISKDGTFRTDGLVPSLYTALVCCSSGQGPLRKQIDLTEGDADNVVLEPAPRLNFFLHVRVEGRDAKSLLRDVLLDDSHTVYDGQPQPNGTLKFSEVTPGEYRIRALGGGVRLFLKRMWVDGEAQAGRVLDLRTAHPATVEAILSSRVASITGQVTAEHGFASGVTVVLEEEPAEDEPFITDADSKGQFEFRSLAPGKYRLYAFEDFDRDTWGDPEVKRDFRSKSVPVTLQESEHCRVTAALVSFELAAR